MELVKCDIGIGNEFPLSSESLGDLHELVVGSSAVVCTLPAAVAPVLGAAVPAQSGEKEAVRRGQGASAGRGRMKCRRGRKSGSGAKSGMMSWKRTGRRRREVEMSECGRWIRLWIGRLSGREREVWG